MRSRRLGGGTRVGGHKLTSQAFLCCVASSRRGRLRDSMPFHAVVVLFLSFLLQGCLNSVKEVSLRNPAVSKKSALMVVGIGVSPNVSQQSFSMRIEQVDPATGTGGNCRRWNRAEMTTTAAPGVVEYRAFEVPPGVYARAWDPRPLSTGGGNAFVVPAGKVVYLGDFIRESDQRQNRTSLFSEEHEGLGRDLDRARAALPSSGNDMQLAEITSIPSVPRAFICTP